MWLDWEAGCQTEKETRKTDRLLWMVSQRGAAFINERAHVCKHLKKLKHLIHFGHEMYYIWSWKNFFFLNPNFPSFSSVHVPSLRLCFEKSTCGSYIRWSEKTLQLCGIMNHSYHNLPNCTGKCRVLRQCPERESDVPTALHSAAVGATGLFSCIQFFVINMYFFKNTCAPSCCNLQAY